MRDFPRRGPVRTKLAASIVPLHQSQMGWGKNPLTHPFCYFRRFLSARQVKMSPCAQHHSQPDTSPPSLRAIFRGVRAFWLSAFPEEDRASSLTRASRIFWDLVGGRRPHRGAVREVPHRGPVWEVPHRGSVTLAEAKAKGKARAVRPASTGTGESSAGASVESTSGPSGSDAGAPASVGSTSAPSDSDAGAPSMPLVLSASGSGAGG